MGFVRRPARFTALPDVATGRLQVAYATESNPSGCKYRFFTWTAVTVGSNVNGLASLPLQH